MQRLFEIQVFFVGSHELASIFLGLSCSFKQLISNVLIGCWRIFTIRKWLKEATMECKTEASMWKRIKTVSETGVKSCTAFSLGPHNEATNGVLMSIIKNLKLTNGAFFKILRGGERHLILARKRFQACFWTTKQFKQMFCKRLLNS